MSKRGRPKKEPLLLSQLMIVGGGKVNGESPRQYVVRKAYEQGKLDYSTVSHIADNPYKAVAQQRAWERGFFEQILTDENQDLGRLHPLQKAIVEHDLGRVMDMEVPLTWHDCESLCQDFSKALIWQTINQMNNYKDLLKKNGNAGQTCRNWCKRAIQQDSRWGQRKPAYLDQVYTIDSARKWLDRNASQNDFHVFFEKAHVDENSGKQLWKRREIKPQR